MSRRDPKAGLEALFERDFSPGALDRLLRLGEALPSGPLARVLLDPAAEFLRRPGKDFRGRLVGLGWELGGSGEPLPDALASAVEVLHAGSLVMDDIEDDSAERRGGPALHRIVGTPRAINLGTWLLLWPFGIVEALGLSSERELALRRRMMRVLRAAHCGQALDLGLAVHEIERPRVLAFVDAVSRLKTGRLMGLAASIGALATGAAEERVEALESFGLELGVALQMLDDLGNLLGRRDPARRHEDLRLGRVTWPWAWLAERRDAAVFEVLRKRARRVAEGGEPAEALAERLGEELAGLEPAQIVHRRLERALAALGGRLGAGADLRGLRAEVARVEASFV